ncbi:hypothetical protein BHM03_00051054, partial [Ensete ventricosum]
KAVTALKKNSPGTGVTFVSSTFGCLSLAGWLAGGLLMLAPKRSARASRDGGVGRGWGWLRSRFAVGAFGRFR